jgi:hypothetical protein
LLTTQHTISFLLSEQALPSLPGTLSKLLLQYYKTLLI